METDPTGDQEYFMSQECWQTAYIVRECAYMWQVFLTAVARITREKYNKLWIMQYVGPTCCIRFFWRLFHVTGLHFLTIELLGFHPPAWSKVTLMDPSIFVHRVFHCGPWSPTVGPQTIIVQNSLKSLLEGNIVQQWHGVLLAWKWPKTQKRPLITLVQQRPTCCGVKNALVYQCILKSTPS
jgi:hypothetical protein